MRRWIETRRVQKTHPEDSEKWIQGMALHNPLPHFYNFQGERRLNKQNMYPIGGRFFPKTGMSRTPWDFTPQQDVGSWCHFGTLTGVQQGALICPAKSWPDENARNHGRAEKRPILRKKNVVGRYGSSVFFVGSFGSIGFFFVGSECITGAWDLPDFRFHLKKQKIKIFR